MPSICTGNFDEEDDTVGDDDGMNDRGRNEDGVQRQQPSFSLLSSFISPSSLANPSPRFLLRFIF